MTTRSRTVIQTFVLIVVAAIVAVLAYAATRPDVFRVERSARIQASPAKLHALIDDMHAFNTWNPYAHKDPAMKGSYSGPSAGAGAHFDFDGKKSGTGYVENTGSTAPTSVRMRLVMTAPFPCDNAIEFALVPQGDATQVTWRMQGPNPFMGKLMGVVFNMDRMVGRDFEAGLASLKTLAERG